MNSDLEKGNRRFLSAGRQLTQVFAKIMGLNLLLRASLSSTASAALRNGTTGGVTFQFDWTPPTTNVGR